ncbi:MAG: divergent PAP2 family protein [Nitrospiraceae bacterium]|nr:divergent PAP2 family protein [Nitrospiraceae bacterium]
MGEWIKQLLNNNILIFTIISNIIAQSMKVILGYTRTGKFDWKLGISNGGNPSSHTSTVTTLTILLGARYGLNSQYFTISFILAFIVIIDALGVRREVGEHSKTMNEIFFETALGKRIGELVDIKKFKELIGHTGLEVSTGLLLGTIIAIIDILMFPK